MTLLQAEFTSLAARGNPQKGANRLVLGPVGRMLRQQKQQVGFLGGFSLLL
jgi:hypothetical protein